MALKALNKRKCKVCGEWFKPYRTTQPWCSHNCAYKWSLVLKGKDEDRKLREQKEALLTHGDYLKIAQSVFNTYIRLRDAKDPCISCDTTNNVKYDAGHYWATTYTFLRFNEDNVHKQCSKRCNQFLSGNVNEYRIRLIRKIGEKAVEKLDNDRHELLKISIPELKELTLKYREKIKALKTELN